MVYMALRVQVKYEECPDVSWLQQWDTPEKYYGGSLTCPKCGCEMIYDGGHKWACDECGRDGDVTHLVWKGDKNEKGMYPGGQYRPGGEGEILAFDEYKATYGNPNKYVYLYVLVESCCDHCGEWGVKDSLGGLGFYEDDPAHWETGTFTEAEVDAMPEGYLRETLQEMLENVKEEAA